MLLRKLCKNCGNAYKSKFDSQIFCSNICKQLYLRKKALQKVCVICGTKFNKKTQNQKWCSIECKNIYNVENNKVGEFIILNRDNFTCIYCGRSPAEDAIKLHIDHVVPISKGGKSNASNLVTSCQSCNLEKSDKIINSEKILEEIKLRNKNNNISNEQLFKIRETKRRIDNLFTNINKTPQKPVNRC